MSESGYSDIELLEYINKHLFIDFIYFKLSGGSFPHITTKEYNTILSVFNVVSSIYDKYKPNDRKSFLNYSFFEETIDNAGESQIC